MSNLQTGSRAPRRQGNACNGTTRSNRVLLVFALFAGLVVSPATAASSGSCTPLPPDSVGWWPGDGSALDAVGPNDGMLKGGAGFATGMVGQSFSVDGDAGSIVEVPSASNLIFDPMSPLTIELWAYRTSAAQSQHLVGKRTPGCGGGDSYQIVIDYSRGLSFNSLGGGVETGVDLPLNTWTHLAGTFDGSTYRFYMDGQLLPTVPGTGTGTLGPSNTDPLTIGTSGGCPGFTGRIDELGIFNRALSQAEIQAIADAGSAGKCRACAQVTFDFVGYPQTWVVPDNVTSVAVDARGAKGGGNGIAPGPQGGKGGRVHGTCQRV